MLAIATAPTAIDITVRSFTTMQASRYHCCPSSMIHLYRYSLIEYIALTRETLPFDPCLFSIRYDSSIKLAHVGESLPQKEPAELFTTDPSGAVSHYFFPF